MSNGGSTAFVLGLDRAGARSGSDLTLKEESGAGTRRKTGSKSWPIIQGL